MERRFILPVSFEKFRHRGVETITRNVPRQTFVQRNGVSRANATASRSASLVRKNIYRGMYNRSRVERRSRRDVRSVSKSRFRTHRFRGFVPSSSRKESGSAHREKVGKIGSKVDQVKNLSRRISLDGRECRRTEVENSRIEESGNETVEKLETENIRGKQGRISVGRAHRVEMSR